MKRDPANCRAITFTLEEGKFLCDMVLLNLNEMKVNMPKKEFEKDEHALMVAQLANRLLRIQN